MSVRIYIYMYMYILRCTNVGLPTDCSVQNKGDLINRYVHFVNVQ